MRDFIDIASCSLSWLVEITPWIKCIIDNFFECNNPWLKSSSFGQLDNYYVHCNRPSLCIEVSRKRGSNLLPTTLLCTIYGKRWAMLISLFEGMVMIDPPCWYVYSLMRTNPWKIPLILFIHFFLGLARTTRVPSIPLQTLSFSLMMTNWRLVI